MIFTLNLRLVLPVFHPHLTSPPAPRPWWGLGEELKPAFFSESTLKDVCIVKPAGRG